MSQGGSRDRRKEQEWRRRIRDWRTSGLSVRAYCNVHGLSEPSFYAWRRELERRSAATAAFVPVAVVADQTAATDGSLVVVFERGRSVRIGPGFDAATLRRLLAVLEEEPC